MKVGIIDYGAGNLLSVEKALDFLGVETSRIRSATDFEKVDAVVLPGVGAFGSAIKSLENMRDEIIRWINSGKPYLGICLGLQLLFEESEESPGVPGLSILKGRVVRFKGGKVPQIGWNQVRILRRVEEFKGIPDGEFFYFLHSFYVVPEDEEIVISRTEYYVEYVSGIKRGNLTAVQFHPEKSGKAGLKFLKNWINHVLKPQEF